ncbi:FAD-binding protein [Nocardiopsis sp. TSRI0078]|uniref:FAD-binding oxidoreductase n=1 Tax=unclassified Nocardiopsis TaxID=2649073 RepID=UPI00093EE7CA|nr:FAD-binding oxidoreductase [Nocardiopsis sp. TSRI0078]OKI17953.1 FAD-binding protein [Nocardiopsis sp. TSRI0078]
MSEKTNDTDMVRDLAGRVTGPVHAPGTDAYDEARTGMQLLDRHRPGAVVEAADGEDVRAAVSWAAGRGLPVSAQLTGHGLGAGMEGGVLIVTHRLGEVRVDPDRSTAWVGAGATWQMVADAAAEHGLAPLSGSAPGVGAVSYTLGGGVGLLARRYGFAADHVRRVDLVTVDGRLRQVTEEGEPDLFWAVRGGGAGAFGVVTGMEIGLFPVPRIYGGSLYLDMTAEPGALEAWRRWTGTVPEELTSGVSTLVYPDMDGVPEELRGRQVAQVSVAWSGAPEQGPAVVEPLRSAAPVLFDTLREMPYAESGEVFDEHRDQAGFRGRSVLVDRLDEEALAGLARLTGSAPFFCVVWLRHLGGALARGPEAANAVGHRGAAYALTVMTFADPEDTGAMRDLREEAAALFDEHAVGRSFTLGFGPMDEEEVREVFDPRDHERLTRLRAEYDPGGILHSNRPIPAGR